MYIYIHIFDFKKLKKININLQFFHLKFSILLNKLCLIFAYFVNYQNFHYFNP